MDERYGAKEKLTKDFEEKHKDFLAKLGRMPAGTKEEKEERRKFFRQYYFRDDFQMEAMRAYRPKVYARLMDRMENPEKTYGIKQDADLASTKNRNDIATLAFVEAVNKAICSYKKSDLEEENYNFLACLGQIYRQEAQLETAKNERAELCISAEDIPERNLCKVVKLIRERTRILQRVGRDKSLEEILEEAQEIVQYKCTKKEREVIYAMGRNISFWESISPGEDEEGNTIEYNLSDGRDEAQEIVDRRAIHEILEELCENIERKWNLIDSGKGLREKKTIQLFFTSSILRELKLDGNGDPYPVEPAGDKGFYLLLEPQGDFLYQKMLHEKYLCRALVEYPEDFYEVYAKLLREDFKFSDTVIAELEGKNKSTISREKKKYLELMEALCRYS